MRPGRLECGRLTSVEARGASDEWQDADLVEGARRGDRQAFDELVQLHLPRVWRVVWRILRHRGDTEDVVQEIFLAVYHALPEFRGESRFSTWLHSIAVNRALNFRSRAARLRRETFPMLDREGEPLAAPGAAARRMHSHAGDSPLRDLELKELRRRLAVCFEGMPAAWRVVLALRLDESLSYEEISRAVGTALGTVRSRLARARLALRRCLTEAA